MTNTTNVTRLAIVTGAVGGMGSATPLGRYGTSDEIAKVALFLCSPGASFLSGSDIKVDGGVLAAMS